MSQVKFISGDGVEHEVEHDSIAADIMRQAGFRVISDEPVAAAAAPEAVKAPMKRPEIVARAKELGLQFKSNEKNAVLLEMIAAAEAEDAEDEESE